MGARGAHLERLGNVCAFSAPVVSEPRCFRRHESLSNVPDDHDVALALPWLADREQSALVSLSLWERSRIECFQHYGTMHCRATIIASASNSGRCSITGQQTSGGPA